MLTSWVRIKKIRFCGWNFSKEFHRFKCRKLCTWITFKCISSISNFCKRFPKNNVLIIFSCLVTFPLISHLIATKLWVKLIRFYPLSYCLQWSEISERLSKCVSNIAAVSVNLWNIKGELRAQKSCLFYCFDWKLRGILAKKVSELLHPFSRYFDLFRP